MPEAFGAKGDGVSDDSMAMAALSNAVTLYGGGTVVFRQTTYLVGNQGLQPSGKYMFPPNPLLMFKNCARPLSLLGNGARLQCRNGLRYGVFGANGTREDHPMPYLGDGLATPYDAMIHIEGCSGSVVVSDFALIGPGDAVVLGGMFGDVGWQIPAYGLRLIDNRGGEAIERMRLAGHPLDGLSIDGAANPLCPSTRTITDVISDRNGRQGCSLIGGSGYRFSRCSFTRTGRGKIRSAPGAGFDIEAEGGKRIRDIGFDQCRFADNLGCGMVADSGDSADVRFTQCTFVGTTSWAAWPSKPLFRFAACTFVGGLVRAYGDPDPARATQFVTCSFTDDPGKTTDARIGAGANADRPIADLSNSQNILFDRCSFRAVRGTLPWSTAAIYRDCTMVQGMQAAGHPRGRFVGANSIHGKVDLSGSKVSGTLIVNGQQVAM
ncbi:hypothetical protein QP178_20005 [Sphingomonas aurantiaca]|uniref:right-handed parallel beta-helix repeat-containing protein n=1 Tax=Sphingomonas aurantiaca TaxID=185949 RepID=UPI002FDF9E1F